MVIGMTRQPDTTTNRDAIVPKGKQVEVEWYVHPSTQEGGWQFHSCSNDRELTVMGLFGTFMVEPRGREYLDPLGSGDPAPIRCLSDGQDQSCRIDPDSKPESQPRNTLMESVVDGSSLMGGHQSNSNSGYLNVRLDAIHSESDCEYIKYNDVLYK
ncbi:MAG: hypothetical protein KGO23_15605 [Nitrospirota bacterium]|nr:hypothetical protein [Nitrospirota bacterium]